MLNKIPSYAREKAWLERITQHGCVITGTSWGIERHHPLGREARQNKFHIGRRYVYPLIKRLHYVHDPDPLNITNHKNAFIDQYGTQSDLFYKMCMAIKQEDGALPFEDEILQAIMDTES